MKHLILVPALLVVPHAAHAQVDVILSGGRPAIRARVGGVPLSIGIGSTGRLGARVADRRVATSSGRSRAGTGSARRTSASAAAVLNTADAYVGTKYVWGGETPRGFDCSGFVQFVFRKHGVELPRTSRQQARVGEVVARSLASLEGGDLMFFSFGGKQIDHVAIYAGSDQIIHSSSTNGGVAYDDFNSERGRFFLAHHVATRRVLAGGNSLVEPLTAALRAFVGYDPPDPAPRR